MDAPGGTPLHAGTHAQGKGEKREEKDQSKGKKKRINEK